MSDDDHDDSSYDIIGKKKNVASTTIKHDTKAAKYLKLITNGFNLTYQEVKDWLLSNDESYRPHTLE